MAEVPPKFTVE